MAASDERGSYATLPSDLAAQNAANYSQAYSDAQPVTTDLLLAKTACSPRRIASVQHKRAASVPARCEETLESQKVLDEMLPGMDESDLPLDTVMTDLGDAFDDVSEGEETLKSNRFLLSSSPNLAGSMSLDISPATSEIGHDNDWMTQSVSKAHGDRVSKGVLQNSNIGVAPAAREESQIRYDVDINITPSASTQPSLAGTTFDAQATYPPSACIFVANLPREATDQFLHRCLTYNFGPAGVFENQGGVGECWVKVTRSRTKRAYGDVPVAHIQYKTEEEARFALARAQGKPLDGRPMRLEMAKASRDMYLARKDGLQLTELVVRQHLRNYRVAHVWSLSETDRAMFELAPGGMWAQFELYGEFQKAVKDPMLREHPQISLVDTRKPAQRRNIGGTGSGVIGGFGEYVGPVMASPFHGAVPVAGPQWYPFY